MGLTIRVPDSIFSGWAWNTARFRVGLLYHSLQCDQRWIFLFRWHRPRGVDDIRFGFRTRGEATPEFDTYKDAGWHWPWKFRFTSGRG
jgi:hypothetical protein